MSERDWTVDPATGRSNSSAEFGRLCEEVGRLIRDSAFGLIRGQTRSAGLLVMAQLAHKHGLAPLGGQPSLPTHRPASEDLQEWVLYVERLERGLYRCAELAGADVSGGVPDWPPLDEWAVEAVQNLRDDYDQDSTEEAPPCPE